MIFYAPSLRTFTHRPLRYGFCCSASARIAAAMSPLNFASARLCAAASASKPSPCTVSRATVRLENKLTGRKEDQKLYRHHTGYPGGLVEIGAKKMRATRPAKMLEQAIAGMLPKNKLGKQMYRKLKVYAGEKHPHQAQKPVDLSIT